MTTDDLMRIVCPQIRDLAWAYYFVEETTERGKELGLDALTWYFIGRGGVLGDVEPTVARAAFGYFEPGLFEAMWNNGRATGDAREAGSAHFLCAAEHGRRKLSGVEGLDALCAAAEKVNAAADETALTLYAAFRAQPLVDDLPGRTMQVLALLREYRGSAHLLALRAVGLESAKAHAVNRPNDLAMFGWQPEDVPQVTDEDRELWRQAEELTDRIVRPAYSVLDESERKAFIEGMAAVTKALT